MRVSRHYPLVGDWQDGWINRKKLALPRNHPFGNGNLLLPKDCKIMESRRFRSLLVIVMLASASFLSYSVGRQTGEQESRQMLERQMSEMRLALTASVGDEDHDVLYHGDVDYEDEDTEDYDEQDYEDQSNDAG